ncbi:MAG: hypothetical protein ACR650_10290 [Methylocystis sp.]|jgi:hypothetical protein
MAQALFQTSELLRGLEGHVQKLAEPIRLFRAPVLHSLCRWANTKLPNEYAVVGHAITVTGPYGHVDPQQVSEVRPLLARLGPG